MTATATVHKLFGGYPAPYSKQITTAAFNEAKYGVFEARRGEKYTYAYKSFGKVVPCSEKFARRLNALTQQLKSFGQALEEMKNQVL